MWRVGADDEGLATHVLRPRHDSSAVWLCLSSRSLKVSDRIGQRRGGPTIDLVSGLPWRRCRTDLLGGGSLRRATKGVRALSGLGLDDDSRPGAGRRESGDQHFHVCVFALVAVVVYAPARGREQVGGGLHTGRSAFTGAQNGAVLAVSALPARLPCMATTACSTPSARSSGGSSRCC